VRDLAVRRRASAAVFSLCLALLAGCSVRESDLEKWKTVSGGDRRLAGFMADPSRDLDLRVRAARALFEMGAPGLIIAVIDRASPEDRALVGAATFAWLRRSFQPPLSEDDPSVPMAAKDLLYALLPYVNDFGDELTDPTLVTFSQWATSVLAVPPVKPEKGARRREREGRSVETVALAAGLVAPSEVAPIFAESLTAVDDPKQVLAMVTLVSQWRDEGAKQRVAAILLERCRRYWPNLPDHLVESVAVNGNETPLRFLLDAARDPAAPLAVRAQVIDAAAERLGDRAIGGLERLLAVEDPLNANVLRWAVLQRLTALVQPEELVETLQSLPDATGWPDNGTAFRDALWAYCDQSLAPLGARIDVPLAKLVGGAHGTARLFAVTCLRRLRASEAAAVLESVSDDATPVRGFSDSGELTLGDIARGRHEG